MSQSLLPPVYYRRQRSSSFLSPSESSPAFRAGAEEGQRASEGGGAIQRAPDRAASPAPSSLRRPSAPPDPVVNPSRLCFLDPVVLLSACSCPIRRLTRPWLLLDRGLVGFFFFKGWKGKLVLFFSFFFFFFLVCVFVCSCDFLGGGEDGGGFRGRIGYLFVLLILHFDR